MKSHLKLIDTRNMSRDEWLLYRKNGVGASEVGTIMGLNPWQASIELFQEKIGAEIRYNIENIHMFMGKEQESFIAELWQYWAGTEESMIENYRLGKIQRRCARVNAYVTNPKYPWLFVSLDRKINKHAGKEEGALEVKTISGYEADKWEAGIPPSHIVQVQTQCLVCEFDYGELATLRDGRRFEVIPFLYNKEIAENILEHTLDFWKRVEKGREIVTQVFEAKRKFNYKLVEELGAQLSDIEPPPDNSEAYANYLKAKYDIARAGERAGTIVELEDARENKRLKEAIKGLTEDNRLFENKLKSAIGEMERLDFGTDGYVSWKNDINGVRRFINKVK